MKKLLIALCAVALTMTACQKEPSHEDPDSNTGGNPGGGSNPSGLLARMVFLDAASTDSLVSVYSYDASGRLMQVDYNSLGVTEQIRFLRNSAGIITQSITKSPDVSSLGLDSLVTRYHYNAAAARYQTVVFDIPVQTPLTYSDSTVFAYDAAGNITSKISYASSAGVFVPYEKFEYAYGNGNVTSVKDYDYTGAWELNFTFNYSYDSKTNPLQLGAETVLVNPYAMSSFGLNSAIYFGPNNASLIDYVDTEPSDNFQLRSTFTYNAANKPVGGTAVQTPSGAAYNWRFYYY